MTIVPMTPETAPRVAALERVCFSDPWSEQSIRAELENPWAIWLTALEDGKLAGYLGIQYGPDGADIMNIATDPGFRGRGIAKALLGEMCGVLQEKGLKWLTLEVRETNAPAMGLYTGWGFRQVGRRKGYYRSPREDAILMTKYFSEGNEHADSGN